MPADVIDGEVAAERAQLGPEESTALALVQQSDAIAIRRNPSVVLDEAIKAAHALKRVLDNKPDKVMMGGKQYIEQDDWQTIGHFYGITAKIESDDYVEYGNAQGWEATAVAVSRDGREIGRTTMMCMNDEEKWSTRNKLAWCYRLKTPVDGKTHSEEDPGSSNIVWEDNPNKAGGKRPAKDKISVGSTAVPMFQLRSMAQTRAMSKVLRSVLGFVPVLAGFGSTPAEELDNAERVENSQPARREPPPQQQSGGSARASMSAGQSAASQDARQAVVGQAAIKAFWSWVESSGFDVEAIAVRVKEHYKCKSSTELTSAQFDELKAWVAAGNAGKPTTSEAKS